MSQCSLRSQDGKSDKFWTIVLSGTSHTVTYGRYGTGGQTQTKDFPTTEAASKSYEKLVAEKVKKGYMDDGVVSGNPQAATTDSESQEQTNSPIGKSPQQKQAAEIELKIERSLNLEPSDWAQATWRGHVPLERPAPRKFDIKLIENQLDDTDDIYTWRWFEENITVSLSPEEAHFWLLAMLKNQVTMRPKELFKKIPKKKITGHISTTDFYAECLVTIADTYRYNHKYIVAERLPKEACIPLFHLFSWEQFLDLLLLRENVVANFSETQKEGFKSLQQNLIKGLNQYILPFLTAPEIAALREEVAISLKLEEWPQGSSVHPAPLFYLAANLGVASLQKLVEAWPDDCYADPHQSIHWHVPQSIIFGLADPESVRKHMQRLGLSLNSSDYLRKWLAHTEFSAIDYIGKSILSSSYKDKIEELTKELVKCVQAPELAPVLLNLMINAKAPRIAQAWLQKNPGNAIAGLIPIVTGPGKLAQSTIDFLISMKRQGHGAFIETCLLQESPEVVAAITSMVLESPEDQYIPLDDESTPDWLQAALNTVKPSKKQGWIVAPADLSTITISTAPPQPPGQQRLNDNQVSTFLDALSQSELDQPHPMLSSIKEHIDRVVLDKFIWRLFEAWLNGGAPPKGKWAMQSIGLLGSDRLVFKLAPLIRIWPGESQHGRAVSGLECLRAIGTDAALMQINGIAQKIKFQGLKSRAQSCIQAIAKERGMTTERFGRSGLPCI
jgi:predicted DNA-binding WGR domain protein